MLILVRVYTLLLIINYLILRIASTTDRIIITQETPYAEDLWHTGTSELNCLINLSEIKIYFEGVEIIPTNSSISSNLSSEQFPFSNCFDNNY